MDHIPEWTGRLRNKTQPIAVDITNFNRRGWPIFVLQCNRVVSCRESQRSRTAYGGGMTDGLGSRAAQRVHSKKLAIRLHRNGSLTINATWVEELPGLQKWQSCL